MDEQKFEAVYEDEVFKPVGVVSLPAGTKVVVLVPASPSVSCNQDPVDAKVINILSRRYNSGQTDVAARHDDHQPVKMSLNFERT